MTKFIILRGCENTGKTTTCNYVYKQLLKSANTEHLFGWPEVSLTMVTKDSRGYDKKGLPVDIKSVMTIGNKKVGILSRGDIVEPAFTKSINEVLSQNVDVFLCCTRSKNRNNSTYAYIEEISKGYPREVFWTNVTEIAEKVDTVKRKQAEEITEYILDELKK